MSKCRNYKVWLKNLKVIRKRRTIRSQGNRKNYSRQSRKELIWELLCTIWLSGMSKRPVISLRKLLTKMINLASILLGLDLNLLLKEFVKRQQLWEEMKELVCQGWARLATQTWQLTAMNSWATDTMAIMKATDITHSRKKHYYLDHKFSFRS